METHLLQDLAVVMLVAGAMTLLCHRFQQPVVIGYLVAGLLVGPYTPPFATITNLQSIHTMAELGLVFLLFSLGLEFNLPKIRKVGTSAGLATLLEVISMLAIGFALGQAFGWKKTDSVFLGAILCVSSTTIIVKVLMDFKMMQEKFVQVVFGILVLEDIVAVVILSILSGLGTQSGPDLKIVVSSFARVILFIILFLVLGLLIVPRFVHWVAKFKAKEVLGIVTLGICLSGALVAHYFQLSVALGAFLAGAILAASNEIHEIEEWIHPIRDMFSAIFFVSAGMLIQPRLLWEYKGAIAIVTVVTIIGKVFSGTVGSFLAGYDIKTASRVGMSLAQIGEFSFVIASLGVSLKVTSDFLYPLAITVSSLTTLATPYLIQRSDHAVDFLLAVTPAGFRAKLDGYHAWLEVKSAHHYGQKTEIFSKYLVRLGTYLAIFVAILALSKTVLGFIPPSLETSLAVWGLSALVCLPLFLAISKYSNHILLLLVTRSKHLLHLINVNAFYNALDALTVSLLEILIVVLAAPYVGDPRLLYAMAFLFVFVSFAFRKKITVGKELLESALDQIFGLATSEPTRQAVLRSGDRTILTDITDQVTLSSESIAHRKTVREIRLREQTGATLVAIYREGNHIANPGPDTELLVDDVLIMLGNPSELEKARKLLNES